MIRVTESILSSLDPHTVVVEIADRLGALVPVEDRGVETGDHHSVSMYAPPPKRSKGVMVKDVPELVAALKAKGLL